MNFTQLKSEIEPTTIGASMHELIRQLYPICRSITGDGVRETLGILGSQIPLEIKEVPTGTEVFDWTVPREWNIRRAWIKGPDGSTVLDFEDSNLHVLNYSVPVTKQSACQSYANISSPCQNNPTGFPTGRPTTASVGGSA